MTEEKIIVILSCVFLGTFVARNSIVKAKTRQRIRASDLLATTSMILTSLCIFVPIFSISSDNFYQALGKMSFLRISMVSHLGLSLFAISIIIGWVVSAQLKESWRVGVHNNQTTKLIQSGIYKFVRNPYFLSYVIMFIGLFLVRPSVVMVVLIVITITLFHLMVLKEEAYLSKIHGKQYVKYKEITGRYIPYFAKGDSSVQKSE